MLPADNDESVLATGIPLTRTSARPVCVVMFIAVLPVDNANCPSATSSRVALIFAAVAFAAVKFVLEMLFAVNALAFASTAVKLLPDNVVQLAASAVSLVALAAAAVRLLVLLSTMDNEFAESAVAVRFYAVALFNVVAVCTDNFTNFPSADNA